MSVESIDPKSFSVPVWRASWSLVVLALAAGLMSLWPFWDGLVDMWSWWVTTAEYSHCLLIPPIAAFLIWQRKDSLERIAFTGSWLGVTLVVFGGAVLLVGELGTVYALVNYAYILTLYGLILSFVGWRAFKLIAVPMLILLFMVPFPQFVFANLSTKLQLLSSQFGVSVMRLLDISVFLEGNVIDLGGYKLQVAEACSGLRYLLPLMTLGFLMAYFYKGALWKRALVFLSSIPITVFMNSLRIAVIGVTVEHWGIAMAEGFLHEFQGWMVFMISAALLLGEIAVLNRIGHETAHWRVLFGVEFPPPTPRGAAVHVRKFPVSLSASMTLLLVFGLTANLVPRPAEITPPRAAFAEFPMHVGDWSGRPDKIDAVVDAELRLDDYLLANYVNGSGQGMNLYVSWYNSQRKGEAVHSPRSCLPGGGWQMTEFGQREIPGVKASSGRSLRVNRAVVELGDERELVYYWFQQRGRIVTNEFAVKWFIFWDSLTRHRTDGALVRLITPISKTGDVVGADRAMADFASRIAPSMGQYIPN